jgi:hypothetical protein
MVEVVIGLLAYLQAAWRWTVIIRCQQQRQQQYGGEGGGMLGMIAKQEVKEGGAMLMLLLMMMLQQLLLLLMGESEHLNEATCMTPSHHAQGYIIKHVSQKTVGKPIIRITRHTSHVTRHTSHVTRHEPCLHPQLL